MITIQVNSQAVLTRLTAMPQAVRAALERQVYRTAVDLQRYIVQQHLSAPGTSKTNPSATLLHRVTGRLARSIQQQVSSNYTGVIGKVYSAGDVPYARIHEYGGQISRHGKKVGDYTINIPARPYMSTSLMENKDKIIQDMRDAVKAGLNG